MAALVSREGPVNILHVENLVTSGKSYCEILGLARRDYPVDSELGKNAIAPGVQGTTIVLMASEAAPQVGASERTGAEVPSPDHRDRILPDCFIASDQRDVLNDCLGDEETISRIPMDRRQRPESLHMRLPQRQHRKSESPYMIVPPLDGVGHKCQMALLPFDNQFHE